MRRHPAETAGGRNSTTGGSSRCCSDLEMEGVEMRKLLRRAATAVLALAAFPASAGAVTMGTLPSLTTQRCLPCD